MKIFFQLMSIIKFMGKSIILRSGIDKGAPNEKEKRADQRHTMVSTTTSEFYQNNIKPVSQAQERENFRMKEMASHIFKDIKQEVANLEKEHKNDSLENAKDYEVPSSLLRNSAKEGKRFKRSSHPKAKQSFQRQSTCWSRRVSTSIASSTSYRPTSLSNPRKTTWRRISRSRNSFKKIAFRGSKAPRTN